MQIMLSEIYAASYMNDVENELLLTTNPALYLRRMYGFAELARNYIRTPRIFASIPFTAPIFDSAEMIADGVTDTWDSGLIGFDVVIVNEFDEDGNVIKKYSVDYVRHTGMISFNEMPPEDAQLSADAYSDGWFEVPEGYRYKEDFIHIMRIAMLMVWEKRFSSSSLDRMQKPSDRTFSISSEGNWLRENQIRAKDVKTWFNNECLRVQQMITLDLKK